MSLRREGSFLLLFTLAVINDALDVIGKLTQPYETFFDIFLAFLISIIMGHVDVWAFLITFLDALPLIDLPPLWTLYILYRYLAVRMRLSKEKKVKVKVK